MPSLLWVVITLRHASIRVANSAAYDFKVSSRMCIDDVQHVDLALPQEMIDGVEQFKEFYEQNTKHRKLGWVYALGTCLVKANFDAKPIELTLSTFQASLLLLFNTGTVC